MKIHHLVPLVTLLALSACAAPVAPPAAETESFASVAAATDPFAEGRFRVNAGYRPLADDLIAYESEHIDRVELTLVKQGSGTVATTTVYITPANPLTAPVRVYHLKMGATYTVQATAFNAAGEQISTAVASANTSAPFTMPNKAGNPSKVSTTPVTFSIPIQLSNRTFPGEAIASPGFDVTDGQIVDSTATESFSP